MFRRELRATALPGGAVARPHSEIANTAKAFTALRDKIRCPGHGPDRVEMLARSVPIAPGHPERRWRDAGAIGGTSACSDDALASRARSRLSRSGVRSFIGQIEFSLFL